LHVSLLKSIIKDIEDVHEVAIHYGEVRELHVSLLKSIIKDIEDVQEVAIHYGEARCDSLLC
jgi:hypothetical protein